MAEAVRDLLLRLSDKELEMMGLTAEEVSDTEEGTAEFVVNKPMAWL